MSEFNASPDVVTPSPQPVVAPLKGRKTVLVTGAAGFIGSSVSLALLERGDEVIGVDEVNDYYDPTLKNSNIELISSRFPDSFKFYRSDVCDADFMETVFAEHQIKFVCHLAARAGVRPSIQDPQIYIHSNIKGTTVLMELCHKFRVSNFVYASSSSVYGGSKSALFSEDEPVDKPVSPYAATKKACELLAFTYSHLYSLPTTGLRFFTVFGPRGRPDMAPFKFIDRISRGIQIDQFGDGSSSRDYTYITDIVDGVVRSIDRPYPNQVFNLGKGKGTSLGDFISIVEKNVGKKANKRILPDQPGDVPYTCADVSKAKHFLGYVPKVTFEEGIRRTVKWYTTEFDLNIEPETQANGLARASSFSDVDSILEQQELPKDDLTWARADKKRMSPKSAKIHEEKIWRCPELALPS